MLGPTRKSPRIEDQEPVAALSTLAKLPNEVMHAIAAHCSVGDVSALASANTVVCRAIGEGDEPMWQQLLLSEYPAIVRMRGIMHDSVPSSRALLRRQLVAPPHSCRPATAAVPAFSDLLFGFEFGAVGGEEDVDEQDASALGVDETAKELRKSWASPADVAKLTKLEDRQALLQTYYHEQWEEQQREIALGFVPTGGQSIAFAFEDGTYAGGKLRFKIPEAHSAGFGLLHKRLEAVKRDNHEMREQCGATDIGPLAEEHCEVQVHLFDRKGGGIFTADPQALQRTDQHQWHDPFAENGTGGNAWTNEWDRLCRGDDDHYDDEDDELDWIVGFVAEISDYFNPYRDCGYHGQGGECLNNAGITEEHRERHMTEMLDAWVLCASLIKETASGPGAAESYFIVIKVVHRWENDIGNFTRSGRCDRQLLDEVPEAQHDGAGSNILYGGAGMKRFEFRGRSPGQAWLDTIPFAHID